MEQPPSAFIRTREGTLLEIGRIFFDGTVLKPYLDAAGMSRYRLSKAVGCSEALLSRIWSGERSISLELARSICEVLGVSFGEIFGPQLATIGLQPLAEPANV